MIVAITGKIASGKSVATNIIRKLGYQVFDCDYEIKRIYQERDIEIITLIGNKFTENKSFNYSLIKEEAFNNIYFDRTLKEYLFKILKENLLCFFESNKQEKLLFIDAPTLYEAKFNYLVDKVIFIDVDRAIAIQRISTRKHMRPEDLEHFEALGYPIPYKKHLSDYIITNNGSLEEFQEKIINIINKL